MFKKRDANNQSNFWISYADLMAGLLFVFILLIGAIVSKSMILSEDLHKKEDRLKHTEISLEQKEKRLDSTKTKLKKLESQYKIKNRDLKQSKITVNRQQKTITEVKKVVTTQDEKIRLQAEEVKKLYRLLANLKSSIKQVTREKNELNQKVASQGKLIGMKNSRIDSLKSLITLTKESLKLNQDNLEKLNQLLLARNSKMDRLSKKVILLQNVIKENNVTLSDKEKKIQDYEGRVIVLSNSLTKKEDELSLKDKKLASLLEALDNKKTIYDEMIKDLQSKKAKIRSLTGIKLKVIAALKKTLGKKIDIDKKSGALKLSSNILFDRGSSELKDASKDELQGSFEEYIGALLSDEGIRPYLDRIVIEGHTDSDGTYMYNLKLSQDRARAVLDYLLTLPITKKYNLKKYLVASGRAYIDSVKHNGVEDKEASRRIEIKFRLKNQDAMHEIERILDDGKKIH